MISVKPWDGADSGCYPLATIHSLWIRPSVCFETLKWPPLLFVPHFLTVVSYNVISSLFSPLQCNNDYAPVCGSNNQNYQNECFLRRDACKQQSEVLIMSEGACPAGMYINIRHTDTNKNKKTTHTQLSTDTNTTTVDICYAVYKHADYDTKQMYSYEARR